MSRTDTITVTVNEDERERIRRVAKAAGFKSMSAYVRFLVEKDGEARERKRIIEPNEIPNRIRMPHEFKSRHRPFMCDRSR